MLAAIILGIVEGLTEFLPVSSTGHLIVASSLLRFKDADGTFEIVIQLGAILALVWHYRKDLGARLRDLGSPGPGRRFALALLVAVIPAALAGVALEKAITAHLFRPTVVAAALILGGLALLAVERRPRPATVDSLDDVTPAKALWIGLAQVASLLPGVSRSGASIVGGLLTGLSRETATAFSFYLAVPTLGGATLYKLAKELRAPNVRLDLPVLAVGTAAAFVSALLVIGWFLRFVAGHDFRGFAYYRIAAGLAILALAAAGGV